MKVTESVGLMNVILGETLLNINRTCEDLTSRRRDLPLFFNVLVEMSSCV